ncbi:MAG: trypsin-like peptidase domain-containing protein [Methylocystis sp.]|nr:trypsin-like peptidase domain-containing protein [Methylocystis sp.]MBI3275193.1 trypsin-like peptidase domain-containing protein [Methylocystis sp.]
MRNPLFRLLTAAFFLTAGLTGPACAQLFRFVSMRDYAGLAATPVMVLGADERMGVEQFAAAHKLAIDELRRAHAASGLVECGDAHGAGQLTLATNVITTAAHVFFDEQGERRAATCNFVAEIDGEQSRIAIDMTSIVAGTLQPYAVKAVHDWAVARLTRPLDGASPYELASDLAVNDAVEFVARGHSDWGDGRRMSFQDCALRAQTNAAGDGAREFAFDCGTGDGASGGAVLLGDQHRRLGAILVGWRSANPSKTEPFSANHYNFVVSIEGAFRRAVLYAAKRGSDERLIAASARHTVREARTNLGAVHRSAARH